MKTIFTFLIAVIFSLNLTAQDTGFVHTVTADNISVDYSHVTRIDHPLLNGNPDAKILFVQRYNGTSNNNPTGLWYDGSRWTIYNENWVDMPIGARFNIYVADHSEVATHVANASNITLGGIATLLDGYTESNFLFANTYYNPHDVYNTKLYAHLYAPAAAQRSLITEDLTNIPMNAGFRVMRGLGTSATHTSVASNSANTEGNSLRIDHPELNGNPDAVFLYSHYYAYEGHGTLLPHVTEAWYQSSIGRWVIFKYGSGVFPENVWIDIIIPNTVLSVEDVRPEISKITLYPNPVEDEVTISSSLLPVQTVEIYDIQGKLTQSYEQTGTNIILNVSALQSGLYLAKVKTEEGWFSQKLIKK